jgi:hypothetical protein
MARRKAKTTRRRSPKRVSLIDLGVTLAVANATTNAFAGTTLFKFATEGWLTSTTSSATGGSGNSWTFSAKELVMGVLDPTSNFGIHSTWQGGIGSAIKKNWRDNGAMAVGTAIAAPILGKIGKRLLRGQIRDANKLLKWSGVSSALGVKV